MAASKACHTIADLASPLAEQSPLPANHDVTTDLSNHIPNLLPCPEGWEVLQRNGCTLITSPGRSSEGLDGGQPDQSERFEAFLKHVRASCLDQQRADSEGQVHWSRHLLTYLRNITGAELLIGPQAISRNPHFQHLVSPFTGDQRLGAAQEWPQILALLLLDSFEPAAHQQLWSTVTAHAGSSYLGSSPGSRNGCTPQYC